MKNLEVYQETNYNKLNMEKILENFGWVPKQGSTVLIKPNLSAIWSDPGEITHPKLISSLIKYLQKFNCKIIIGETDNLGPSDKPWNFDDIIKHSGYDIFRGLPNVEIIDFEKQEQIIKKVDDLVLSIPKIFSEIDYYINVAKIKTHWQASVTLSLKNQMGIMPMNTRKIFHREGLEESIAKLSKVIKPDLVIIDGVEGMEGQAPHWGELKKSNMIIVGTDMIRTDSLASYLMGFDPEKILHINLAKNFSSTKIDNIDFKVFEKFKDKFKVANGKIPISYKKISVWQEGGHACTGCGRAVELLKRNILKQNMKLIIKFIFKAFFQKTDIILGKVDPENTKLDFSKMGKVYCIGNCTKELAEKKNFPHLPGCSPTNQEVMDWIFGKK